MGPPLYEDQTLLEADIARGATLILEPGPVPLRSQVGDSLYTMQRFIQRRGEQRDLTPEVIATVNSKLLIRFIFWE